MQGQCSTLSSQLNQGVVGSGEHTMYSNANSCMHVYIYIKKFMKIICSARHTQYMYFIRLIMWELILHFQYS